MPRPFYKGNWVNTTSLKVINHLILLYYFLSHRESVSPLSRGILIAQVYS
jgi:hypothetical protein